MNSRLPDRRLDSPEGTFTKQLKAQRTQRLGRKRASQSEYAGPAHDDSGWPETAKLRGGNLKPGPGDRS